MNSETNRDQSGESNAGAAKTNQSQEALRQGVRKNASHPGDASHAAGMRHSDQSSQSSDSRQEGTQSEDNARQHPTDR